jgi:hypothetical protein
MCESRSPGDEEAPVFDFFFKGVGIEAQRKGYLSLQFSQHNEQWKELSRLTISSGGSPSPSGPEQSVSQYPSAAPASLRRRGQRRPSSL